MPDRIIPQIPIYRGQDRDLQVVLDKVREAIFAIVDTDFITENDIYCRDIIISDNSLYLGAKDNKHKLRLVTSDGDNWIEFNDQTLAKESTLNAHGSRHESGGDDEINHDDLTGFEADEHYPAVDEDDMSSNLSTSVPTQQSVKQFADTVESVITSTTTVENTTVETTIFTASVPADSLAVGEVLKLHCDGDLSNDSASDDVTIKVKLGSITLQTFKPAIGNVTNDYWEVNYFFTVRSLGATGSIAEEGRTDINGNEEVVHSIETVDTTTTNDITVTITWDNAKAGNTIDIYQGYLEKKGPK